MSPNKPLGHAIVKRKTRVDAGVEIPVVLIQVGRNWVHLPLAEARAVVDAVHDTCDDFEREVRAIVAGAPRPIRETHAGRHDGQHFHSPERFWHRNLSLSRELHATPATMYSLDGDELPGVALMNGPQFANAVLTIDGARRVHAELGTVLEEVTAGG